MNSEVKRSALVTGASRGLGKSIALELARRGVPTILVATNERVREVCEEIVTTYHVSSECYITDLTKRKNVLSMVEAINCQFEVFMLVNNAGVGGTKRIEDADVAYLENIINLNVRCTALLTQALLPNLKRQPKSYILNISSMAALTPVGYKTVYPASKSFVYSFGSTHSCGIQNGISRQQEFCVFVFVGAAGRVEKNECFGECGIARRHGH